MEIQPHALLTSDLEMIHKMNALAARLNPRERAPCALWLEHANLDVMTENNQMMLY